MIDKSKQYKTRDGREVRIYATDGDSGFPIHGAVMLRTGWCVKCWTSDGMYFDTGESTELDLIEVKTRIKREYWFNVYPEGLGCYYETKVKAEKERKDNCIACVKLEIDCEEAEGLSESEGKYHD